MLITEVVIVIPAHSDGQKGAREEYLGPDYLDAFLRNKGISSCVLNADFYGLTFSEVVHYCIDKKPTIIGLSLMQPCIRQAFSIVKELRRQGFIGYIVAGGHYPTLCPESTFKYISSLDFIVKGEGEITFYELCDALLHRRDYNTIDGLSYLSPKGELISTKHRRLIDNLDDLPFPSRTILPDVLERGDYHHADILGSRGCPYQCSFCGVNPFYSTCQGMKFRKRSISNIADEIEFLKKGFHLDEFHFSDEIFCPQQNINNKFNIVSEFTKREINIHFAADFRVSDINPKMLCELKKVGLFFVRLGVESGSQKTLDHFNKKTTVEENKKAIITARKLGFGLHIMYIMFEPYSTLETIRKSLNFFQRYCLDQKIFYIFFRYMAYDGLPLTEELRAKGLLREQSPMRGYHSYRMETSVEILYFMMTLVRKKLVEPIFRENDKLRIFFAKHNLEDVYTPHLKQLKYFEKMISRITIKLVQVLLSLITKKNKINKFKNFFLKQTNFLQAIMQYQKNLSHKYFEKEKRYSDRIVLTSIPDSLNYEAYNPITRKSFIIDPQKMYIINSLRKYGLKRTIKDFSEQDAAKITEIEKIDTWFCHNGNMNKQKQHYESQVLKVEDLWRILIGKLNEAKHTFTP